MSLDDKVVETENRMNSAGTIFRRDCVQLNVVEIMRRLSRTNQPALWNVRRKSVDWVQRQPSEQGVRSSLLPVDIRELPKNTGGCAYPSWSYTADDLRLYR